MLHELHNACYLCKYDSRPSQTELRSGGMRLGELELINSQLSEQVSSLQTQLVEHTTQADADKRAALEQ